MPSEPVDLTAAQKEILARLGGLGRRDGTIAEKRDEILSQLARPGLFSFSRLRAILDFGDQSISAAVEKHIQADSQVVERANGALYRLKDDVRSDQIRRKGLGILEGGIEADGWDDFERLFNRVSQVGSIQAEDVAEFGAEFSIRVAHILGSENFPSASKLKSIARTQRRARSYEATKERIFVGREGELAAARQFLVRDEYPRVLQIHGAAGAGKTTLVKKALQRLYHDDASIVVEVDFERPVNDQNLLSFVGRELLYALYDGGFLLDRQLHNLERDVSQIVDRDALIRLLQRPMAGAANMGKRVHFFFDSVEIFVNAFNDPLPLMDLIEALVQEFEPCSVVLATRLSTFAFNVPLETIHLHPLTDDEVRQYCEESNLPPAAELFVLRTLPERNPLLLTLLVEAVKRERSLSFSDLKRGPFNNVLFQRYVIERIIDKLPKFRHRDIAQAALPLRRITQELLAESGIFPEFSRHGDRQVSDIFNELEKQIIFFESGEDGLYIRQDIRSLLLRLGFASGEKEQLNRIRRRALDFYLGKFRGGDQAARKEALYYALSLNSDRPVLEEIWSADDGNELLKYQDDFTPRSRSWLKHKLQRRWRLSDFTDAFVDDAEPESVNFVFNAFYSGRVDSIERLMKAKSFFKSNSYSAIFAEAMVDLARLNYQSAISKIAYSAMHAPPSASHQILQQGLRVAAISDVDAGELIDHARRVYFELAESGGDNRWLASYYSFWIARLLPEPGELRREVIQFKEMLEGIEPRHLAKRSKLSVMQFNDLCLLGSAEDPDFAIYWLQSITPKKLAPSSLRHVYRYLYKEQRHLIPSAAPTLPTNPTAQSSPGERKSWERALNAYLKSKEKTDARDVGSLRQAMLINASDILLGLLIASIERTSARTNVSEHEIVREFLNRKVTGGSNVSSIVAASVRQLARDGDLYEAIIVQRDEYEIRKALTNWLRFFQIDIKAFLPDRNRKN